MLRISLITIICGLISFLFIHISNAQEDISELSIDQAVDLALKENRDLSAAKIEIEESRARYKQSTLFPNPEIEFDFGSDIFFANEGERNFSATISQPISLSGRISAQKEIANANIKRTIANIANLERLLVMEVRRVFIELLAIEDQLVLQENLIELNNELLKAINVGINEGLASQQDLNAVAIALQQAVQKKEVLLAQRKSNLLSLNNLFGKPSSFSFKLIGKLEYEPNKKLNYFNIETAFLKRPDLKFNELNIEQTDADIKLAKALRFEDIKAGIFYRNDVLVLDSPIGELTDNDQLIGFKLTIPLPLFNRQQGLIMETQARKRRAEENVIALKLKISQEVSDALNRISTISNLLDTYKSGILKTAEDNVKIVEDGFKQGFVDIVNVIQSRQQYAVLSSTYINTVRDYELALNDLQISTGNYPSLTNINEIKGSTTRNENK